MTESINECRVANEIFFFLITMRIPPGYVSMCTYMYIMCTLYSTADVGSDYIVSEEPV